MCNAAAPQGVEQGTTQPWHAMRCFGPFAFYDVRGKEAVPGGSASLINADEAGFVLQLFRSTGGVRG